MAKLDWSRIPTSNWARLLMTGGPFDGEEVAFLPPDWAAPAQIVWSGWFPWGFSAYLYEWHGERAVDQGRTDALIYRPPIWQDEHLRAGRGHRYPPENIPPLLADDAEMWADTTARFPAALRIPRDLIWPGL